MSAPGREERPGSRPRRWGERLFEPVDIASLVFLRVAFGGIMAWEAWRYLRAGWTGIFSAPAFHFGFPGFSWVQPWPGDGMLWHFYGLGLLAVLIALGLGYRVAMPLFCLAFGYVFLIDQAYYLNHFYFVCLVSLLMSFAPAHRSFSLDAWLRPSLRASTAPAWSLWMLRAQLGVVYFFGGVAKLNRDWLLGWPMRLWLPDGFELPVLAQLAQQTWVALVFSYGGLLFDLLVVPALLWRPTRAFAFAAAIFFHATNAHLFVIGIFPWLSLAMTALFFEPDWPRRLIRRIGPLRERVPAAAVGAPFRYSRPMVALLSIHFAIQVLVPLRHFLYPGNTSWSEEGHLFAWHMKLRDKAAVARFFLHDPDTGQRWEAEATGLLEKWQYKRMSGRPALVHRFARHLAQLARENGHERVEVRAAVMASLNGYEPQFLIDREVDLAAEPERCLAPAPWILPFDRSVGRRAQTAPSGDGS